LVAMIYGNYKGAAQFFLIASAVSFLLWQYKQYGRYMQKIYEKVYVRSNSLSCPFYKITDTEMRQTS
jgi:hypothetical protein